MTETLARPCVSLQRRLDGWPGSNRPLVGAQVCRFHGGAASQVRAKAVKRVLEAELRRVLLPDVEWVSRNPLEEIIRVRAVAGIWLGRSADHDPPDENLNGC